MSYDELHCETFHSRIPSHSSSTGEETSSFMATPDSSPPDGTPPEPRPGREFLDDILRSTPFRTSRQCQDLFRYIVEHSLAGSDDSLRERVIGIEVFGRAPDYDTAQDPVVRIRAAYVRKRLAEYYQKPKNSSC